MDRVLLGQLASGQSVFDRPNSHIHNGTRELLKPAFSTINLNGEVFRVQTIDFGQVIGRQNCVPTTRKDRILYAKRVDRYGHSRFVQERVALPCSTLVVILKKDDAGDYILITSYTGIEAGPEPWEHRATAQSREFWSRHALVWGCEPVIPNTATWRCPW
jgi:hypothetical protein